MAIFDFLKGKKKEEDKKTARERAAEEAAQRRVQAFEKGYVEHPEVEKEYKRRRFFIVYSKTIRALIYVGIGLIVAVILAVITIVIIQNLPGRDDDKDGVPNAEDVCPGFDDREDEDKDGIPDGCEEQPGSTELSIMQMDILPAGEDRYDVALKVVNPNDEWGASPLWYTIDLLAADGTIINSSERQELFVLPAQQKTLTAFNILAVQESVDAELVVQSSEWLKVQNYITPRFDTTTIEWKVLREPGAFARLKTRVKNLTTFTFNNVQTTILINDNEGNLIALNRSEIDTLQPGEERDFIVTFPQALSEIDINNITYETDVNVFRNDTFVEANVVQGQKFQQFTPQSPP